MTTNQIAYQSLKETQRSNLAKEGLEASKQTETRRSNLANETETHRSNVAKELETARSNMAREAETYRSNVASEGETYRHNVRTEQNDRYRTNTQAVTSIFGTAMNAGTKLATAGLLFG